MRSSLLACLLLLGGCGEQAEPSTAAPAPGLPARASAPDPEPEAPPAQENDCPAHVFCHETWRACQCAANERGDVSQMEADFDGDGTPDLRITYEYDDDGNLLRWNNDQGADGSIETPCTFSPPCPPPHPNDDCSCYGPPRNITPEYVQRRLREAGDSAEEMDPAEAARILEASRRSE